MNKIFPIWAFMGVENKLQQIRGPDWDIRDNNEKKTVFFFFFAWPGSVACFCCNQ